MKTRFSLVSNSSSTSFVIKNISDKSLTIVDFVKENPQLIKEFLRKYDWYEKDEKFTQDNLIDSAINRFGSDPAEYTFKPKKGKVVVFGDEEGDLIGHVFDYILRDGGKSKNFEWNYKEALR
jgi:hypothetical protein